jgi:hypothetical protein
MTKAFLPFLASLGVATLGLLGAAESTAATITLSGATGNSCTYSSINPGTGAGDLIVTCGAGTAQCTLSASPTPVAPGGSVTLSKSAACPADSVLSDTAGGQSNIANPVFIPATATGTRTFYVVSNGQQQASTTVTISGGNSGTAPTCGAVSGPSSVAVSASASFSITCQNATSYSWSAGSLLIAGAANSTAISATAPGSAGNTTVQVTVCGTPATNCVTQSLPVTITGGSNGGQCPAVAGTRTNPGFVEGQTMWDNPGSYDKGQLSGGQIGVYPFVASAQRWARTLSVDANTESGGYNPRDVAISTCPGDFSATVPSGCASYGRSLNVIYSGSNPGYCPLEPGKQYYINVRSTSTSRPISYDAGWN